MLYIGVTKDLMSRIWDHKLKVSKGFTSRYNVDRLVYFEDYTDVRQAIAREKQLKGWTRKRKVSLIEAENPNWDDLAKTWLS